MLKPKFLFLLLTLFFFYASPAQKIDLVLQTGHHGAITCLAMTKDGRFAATGSDDNSIKIWDVKTGSIIKDFYGHKAAITHLCFSDDNFYLLSGAGDKSVKIWEVQRNPGNKILDKESSYAVQKGGGANPLLVGSTNGYSLSAPQSIVQSFTKTSADAIKSFGFPDSEIQTMAVKSDFSQFLVVGKTGVIYLYDPLRFEYYAQLITNENGVIGGFYTSDDKNMVILTDHGFTVWSDKGKLIAKKELDNPVNYRVDNDKIEIVLSKGEVYSFSAKNFKFLESQDYVLLSEKKAFVASQYFSFTKGGRVSILGRDVFEIPFQIQTMVLHPDQKHLFFVDNQNAVSLYDYQNQHEVYRVAPQKRQYDFFELTKDWVFAVTAQKGEDFFQVVDLKHGRIGQIHTSSSILDLFLGNELAAVLSSKGLFIYSLNGYELVKEISDVSPNDKVFVLGDDEMILICSEDGFSVYSVFENKVLNSFKWNSLSSRIVSDNNGVIAYFDSEDELVVQNVFSGEILTSVFGYGNRDFDLNEQILVLQPKEGVLEVRSLHGELVVKPFQTGVNQFLKDIEVSNFEGKTIISGLNSSNQMFVFDASQRTAVSARTKGKLPHEMSKLSFFPNGEFLFFVDQEKNGLIWEWQKANENVFVVGDEGSILVVNDRYIASGDGNELMKFYSEGETYSFEQFDLHFNRPDKVIGDLYGDVELAEVYRKAYNKRLERWGFKNSRVGNSFHIPKISLENFTEIPYLIDGSSLNILLKAEDSKYPLTRINILVNGVPVNEDGGILMLNKALVYDGNYQLELNQGKNLIEVSSVNNQGAESYKVTIEVFSTQKKAQEKIYVLAIGVSQYGNQKYDLKYPSKDAVDFIQLFQNKENVFTRTLLNEDVTTELIQKQIHDINSLMTVNDKFYLYYAGHGLLDVQFNYYLATYNIDFLNPKEKGMSYEQLEKLLKSVKARKKVLFIDACHSGEIDKNSSYVDEKTDDSQGEDVIFRSTGRGKIVDTETSNSFDLMKSTFVDLRAGSGAQVVSAAGGKEYALESDEWNNGIFTLCLIQGLKYKKADYNNDGVIMLSELSEFLKYEVKTLTAGKQQPTFRAINKKMNVTIY